MVAKWWMKKGCLEIKIHNYLTGVTPILEMTA
jgi:hypothetical protein